MIPESDSDYLSSIVKNNENTRFREYPVLVHDSSLLEFKMQIRFLPELQRHASRTTERSSLEAEAENTNGKELPLMWAANRTSRATLFRCSRNLGSWQGSNCSRYISVAHLLLDIAHQHALRDGVKGVPSISADLHQILHEAAKDKRRRVQAKLTLDRHVRGGQRPE